MVLGAVSYFHLVLGAVPYFNNLTSTTARKKAEANNKQNHDLRRFVGFMKESIGGNALISNLGKTLKIWSWWNICV